MSTSKNINNYRIAGKLESILGNRSAAYVLLFIEAYGSGYASQISKTFDIPLTSVQQQLRKLANSGVLVSYTVGKTRVFEFNPRGATVRNLRSFLSEELKFLSSDACSLPKEIYQQIFCQRRRPRRAGKSLDIVPERLRL